MHQGLEVDRQQVGGAKGVSGVFVDRAVGLAGGVDPDQLDEAGEVLGQARLGIADLEARGGLGLSQGQAVVGAVVAVVAQERDRVFGRGAIQGDAQVRRGCARLVAGGEVPLLDRHPVARGDVIAVDAVLDEGRHGLEGEGLALEAADVEVGDPGGVDVRVHQARQHQSPAPVLDLRLRPDQGLGPARRADIDDLAAVHGQGLGGRAGGVFGIDPGVGQHVVGRLGGRDRCEHRGGE